MENNIMPLKEFIDLITAGTNIHICICDLSGMLSFPQFSVDYSNAIHYTEVCNFAKSTDRGLKLCLKCKSLSNKKAIEKKKPFSGCCPCGVTEYIYPVVIDDRVVCIIYVGNICLNEAKTREDMNRVCNLTGVDSSFSKKITCMENDGDEKRYEGIAEAIHSYIMLAYTHFNIKANERRHWVVNAFTKYADTYFNKNITITHLAKLYNINEKYAGRLLKKQIGVSFNEYLNICRVNAAKRMLSMTDMTIAEIALECGYNNITYFNRVFKRLDGQTPREYRKSHYILAAN